MNTFVTLGETTIMKVKYKGGIIDVLVDTDDLELIQGYGTWYGNLINNNIYVRSKKNYKMYDLHRVVTGTTQRDEIVDHKNRNTLDNRRHNLVVTDWVGNANNAPIRKDNKSGMPGVRWREDRKKWYTEVRHLGVKHPLGQYEDFMEAVMVVKAFKNKNINNPTRKPIKNPS